MVRDHIPCASPAKGWPHMSRHVTRGFCAAAGIALTASGLAGAGAADAARAGSSAPGMPFAVDGFLNGVAATSARNVWAVGGNGAGRNLILHWDGTAWKRVPSPNPAGEESVLAGVAALSAANAWAVGSVILHWNGRAWKLVPNPAARSRPGRG